MHVLDLPGFGSQPPHYVGLECKVQIAMCHTSATSSFQRPRAELVGPACTAAAVAQSLQSSKEKAGPNIFVADVDLDCLAIHPMHLHGQVL